jgi:glycosyltransferase involved in cell wall biosynthesis
VHVQYAPVAFRWRRALRRLPSLIPRIPTVVTVHEFEREMLPLLTRANAVITTTAEHAASIEAVDPSTGRRLDLVPIGPNIQPLMGDRALLARTARARWGVAVDAPLVVFFGFLHPVKGLEYLLRAMVQVRERCPRVRLLLAGGWRSLALPDAEGDAYRDRLCALIDELHLGHVVRITGFLPEPDVSALLFAADAVALPFTFGLSFKSGTLIAALAHRCAVVGTQAPVDDPMLRSGEHVLAVPPRDTVALADAIVALLDDAALRERIAAAGAEAAAPFNWNAIAAKHLAVYNRATALRVCRSATRQRTRSPTPPDG